MYVITGVYFVMTLSSLSLEEILMNETNARHSMIQCVERISEIYFARDSSILFSVMQNEASTSMSDSQCLLHDLLQKFHQLNKWSTIILYQSKYVKGSSNWKRNNGKLMNFVFLVNYNFRILENFTLLINELEGDFLWNSRGYFITLLVSENFQDPSISDIAVEYFIRTLWIKNVLRIVVLAIGHSRNVIVYSGFPYEPQKGKCGNIGNIAVLDIWDSVSQSFLFSRNLFPNKVPQNMGLCPMKISVGNFPPFTILTSENANCTSNGSYIGLDGLDVKLLYVILEKLNMSLEFSVASDKVLLGIKNESDLYTGLRGDLIYKKSDIAIGGWMYNFKDNCLLDFTKSYSTVRVTWFVPKAKSYPRFMGLSRIFDEATWFLLCLVILIIAILFHCFSLSVPDKSTTFLDIATSLSNSWSIILSMSVPQMPTTFSLRVLFISFVAFSVCISTVFQAFFTSYLVDPGLQNQVNGIHALLRSGMGFIFYPFQVLYIDKEELQQLTPWYNCTSPSECLNFFENMENVALLANRDFVHYAKPDMILKFHEFAYDMYQIPQVMYLQKSSPFHKRIDTILSMLIDSGLVNNFMMHKVLYGKHRFVARHLGDLSQGYEIMSLSHVTSALLILLVGLGFSFLILILEIFLLAYVDFIKIFSNLKLFL